jgi:hypothetical protein
MTHDPLCPLEQPCERGLHHLLAYPSAPPIWCEPCGTECRCALIAQVVKREQEKAAERIASIEPVGEPFDGGYHDGYRDALDHAEQAVTA